MAQELFEAWVSRLAAEPIGAVQTSVSGDGERRVILGDPAGDHSILRVHKLEVVLERLGDVDMPRLSEVIELALGRVAAGDFGEILVYSSQLTVSGQPESETVFGTHFMRILGDQVHIEGPRRISDTALLHFQEGLLDDAPDEGLLLAPQSLVDTLVFVPAPLPGALSQRAASTTLDVVAAVCALATGRPVRYQTPILPLEGSQAADALSRRYDPRILGLSRDGVSLDFTAELFLLGGPEAMARARGALLSYHDALRQSNPDVAVMLFVSAIEALISPRAEWGKEKVTSRFITALKELCPGAVDSIVDHPNVGQAFDYVKKGGRNRQRTELLNSIYAARSRPTHSGLAPTQSGFPGMAHPGSMRTALLSELARAVILQYLQRPRCWLLGRPQQVVGSDALKANL